MGFKDTWKDKVNGVDVVDAADINSIAQAVIEQETTLPTAISDALEAAKNSGAFDGKSAYEYAVDGGYAGTEEEFSAILANAVDKRNITLGLHTDGLIYLFIDDAPVGNGIALPSGASGDVVGNVDSENNIVLMGNLADGTYTVKYEMEDGSTVNIGSLELGEVAKTYSIIKNLTNCVISNSATSILEGNSYSATITANSGYELKSVSVTMGGSAVSVSDGVINIASVTGNIVITAVAEEKQAAEPITENITVTKEISIVVGTGADRANTQSYCATSLIDVSNIPKPCVIKLKQTAWAYVKASETGYIRFYIADKNGTKLASDYTHSSKMPSGVTMECNNNVNNRYDDVTVTVTSDNVGTLRFSGAYVYDGTGVASEPLATLTYTPN